MKERKALRAGERGATRRRDMRCEVYRKVSHGGEGGAVLWKRCTAWQRDRPPISLAVRHCERAAARRRVRRYSAGREALHGGDRHSETSFVALGPQAHPAACVQ